MEKIQTILNQNFGNCQRWLCKIAFSVAADEKFKRQFICCYAEYKGNRNNLKIFWRYVVERYKSELSSTAYRVFITDSLKSYCRLDGERYYNIYQQIMNADKAEINVEEQSKKIIKNIKQSLKNMEVK